MDKLELYDLIKGRNVKELSKGLRFQCEMYSGPIHKVHGSYKQHFFLLEFGDEQSIGYSTDLTYEELRNKHPEEFEITMNTILEVISKLRFKI